MITKEITILNSIIYIYIYIKNPINSDQMLTFWKKNQGKWTQEVNDYFKDMEVESVNID
jgi:hypothetical protein